MSKLKLLFAASAAVAFLSTSTAGCNAENLNAVIDSTGNLIGVEVDVDIKQEDLDAIEGQVNELKENVETIIEDEEVRDAASNLIDALKGAVEETEE